MGNTLFEHCRSARAVPSLVHSCQRVLAANIDCIAGFGEGTPHRLIRPILQGCGADTLLRLEQETPNLQERTSELWKGICIRVYPIAVEQILSSAGDEPESWRDEFFCIREKEARRFEEAASKVRNQRFEAEEMKRKRQVKLTDGLPQAKRSRSGWSSGPIPPKTLFEKTRKEATKFQRTVFGPRSLPPAIGDPKGFRTNIGVPSAQLSEKDRSIVKINTVTVRNSCPDSLLSPAHPLHKPKTSTRPFGSEVSQMRPIPSSVISVQNVPMGETSGTLSKKDPMRTLFLPRQRISSQASRVPPLSSSVSSR